MEYAHAALHCRGGCCSLGVSKKVPRLSGKDLGMHFVWSTDTKMVGDACRYLPLIGQATIIMNDYPYVKYLLIGVLGIFVITSKD